MRRSLPILLAGWLASSSGSLAQEPEVLRANNPPEWGTPLVLVEEVRLGSISGDGAETFGEVSGLTVVSDGTIWVGDSHQHRILRFDAEGDFLGAIGREGEGPGEFMYPSHLRALPDGNVIVWDPGRIRVSEFSGSGDFVSSFKPETLMIGGYFEELENAPDGQFFLISMTHRIAPGTSPDRLIQIADMRSNRRFWMRMTREGEVLDSIFVERYEQRGHVDPIITWTEVSPLGYRVVARNDEYSFRLDRPDHPIVIERHWEPVEYSRAERSEKQRLEGVFSNRTGRDERTIPNTKPALTGFSIDSEGRIWAQRHAPGFREAETEGAKAAREEACRFFGSTQADCDAGHSEWTEPHVFDVIDASGRFLGEVVFPQRLSEIVFARGRHVWAVETGEYGEDYVVRYRIESR
jgi:hypothetical protein